MSQSVPKLVLLPGMDGTGDLLNRFVDALPADFETKIVRYPTDECLSYSELANLLASSCAPSARFVLVAESFSTPLAVRYAATKPPHLTALVLCAGFAASPLNGWRRYFASLLAPILFRVRLPEFTLKRWLIGPDAPDSLRKDVRTAVELVKPKVLASRFRAVLACDARAELAQIAIPILYIQAERDRLISESCLIQIRRIKPEVIEVEIDGPHLLFQREPAIAADAVAKFVRELSTTPAAYTSQTTPQRDP